MMATQTVTSWNQIVQRNFGDTQWAEFGMDNVTIKKPGLLVTNFPVILMLDTEAFMGTRNLYYTAKLNKSGTAK